MDAADSGSTAPSTTSDPFRAALFGQTWIPPDSDSATVRSAEDEPANESLPEEFCQLLPAAYINKYTNKLSIPSHAVLDFLHGDLVPDSLNDNHDKLWEYSNTIDPPDPLHVQLLFGREVVIVEDMNLHLTTSHHRRLYLKPIPPYLLDRMFWDQQLTPTSTLIPWQSTLRLNIRAAALGFLYSYVTLINHESDFRIAHDKSLVPSSMTWQDWKELASRLIVSYDPKQVNKRFWYGIIRGNGTGSSFLLRSTSSRSVNLRRHVIASRGTAWSDIRQQFDVLGIVLGLIVVVLSAMQVGLSVESYGFSSTEQYQKASWGFSLFAIVAASFLPIFYGGCSVLIFLFVRPCVRRKRLRRHNKFERKMEMDLEKYGIRTPPYVGEGTMGIKCHGGNDL